MSKGSGVSRSDRRRNARRERLRGLLPRDGAVVGIDLGDVKQALCVVDRDEGGRAVLEAAGIPLHALFHRSEFHAADAAVSTPRA